MPSSPHVPASVPAALSAFLRGVERRGALFAELQCGDRDAGDAALAASIRAFRTHAGTVPMADWPRRFWALLVANPQLRHAGPTAAWPPDLQRLALLDASQRRALLLRLAAGLPEGEAADVLGVEMAAYEQALAGACPRDAEGQPDPAAWRALAETIQRQLRDLPPERLARLAALREAAILGNRPEGSGTRTPAPAAATGSPSRQAAAARRWAWVILVAAVCTAALAATWWWTPRARTTAAAVLDEGIRPLREEVEIRAEPLAAQEPAARFGPAAGVLMHPDFALLSQGHEAALAHDADFLSWIASGADDPARPPAEDAGAEVPPPVAGTETTDAQF